MNAVITPRTPPALVALEKKAKSEEPMLMRIDWNVLEAGVEFSSGQASEGDSEESEQSDECPMFSESSDTVMYCSQWPLLDNGNEEKDLQVERSHHAPAGQEDAKGALKLLFLTSESRDHTATRNQDGSVRHPESTIR